jgi:hypothetical protein
LTAATVVVSGPGRSSTWRWSSASATARLPCARGHSPARHHWQHALDILADLGTDHTEDEEAGTDTIRANLAAVSPAVE